jgi:hypothetical protein
MNHDEMTQLWEDLKCSVEDAVTRFNDGERLESDLPRAKPYTVSGDFQICRIRPAVEQDLRARQGKKTQPSKKYLNFTRDESFRGIKIRVDDTTTAYYRYGHDEKGKPVFCANNDATEFTPGQLAQEVLKPFLWDKE